MAVRGRAKTIAQERPRNIEPEEQEPVLVAHDRGVGTLVRVVARDEAFGHQRVLLVRIEQHDFAGLVAPGAGPRIDDAESTGVSDDDHEVDGRIVVAIVVKANGTAAVNREAVKTQPVEGDAGFVGDFVAKGAHETEAEMRSQRIELARLLRGEAVRA